MGNGIPTACLPLNSLFEALRKIVQICPDVAKIVRHAVKDISFKYFHLPNMSHIEQCQLHVIDGKILFHVIFYETSTNKVCIITS